MAHTQVIATASHSQGLAEILERVLDKGVVIAGDIKIKLCDIELLDHPDPPADRSVDKAREMGLTWWWQPPAEQPQPRPLPGQPTVVARAPGARPLGTLLAVPGTSREGKG